MTVSVFSSFEADKASHDDDDDDVSLPVSETTAAFDLIEFMLGDVEETGRFFVFGSSLVVDACSVLIAEERTPLSPEDAAAAFAARRSW